MLTVLTATVDNSTYWYHHQQGRIAVVDRWHRLDKEGQLDTLGGTQGAVGMPASHTDLQGMDMDIAAVPWCSWEEVEWHSLEELEQML